MNHSIKKTATRILTAIEKINQDAEDQWFEMFPEYRDENYRGVMGSPVADCHASIVEVEDSPNCAIVRLTYDGAGYDHWTYNGEFGPGMLREKLQAVLDKMNAKRAKRSHFFYELIFEDCNSWSLEIYVEI